MSFELGSNGGERVEVAAAQGGRRVLYIGDPKKEPLPLAARGVSGWAGYSGAFWSDTPVE